MTSKKVFITGASRGIGAAIKQKFSEEGWTIFAPTRAELDLQSPSEVERWLNDNPILVDTLINNAGENEITDIAAMSVSTWERSLAINLTVPMVLARAAARHMRQQRWGRIVNISSIFGLVTRRGRAPYTAAKTGLVGLTRTAAVEWGGDNVLVNALCPGYIETDLTRKNNSPDQIKELAGALPLQRMGQPEEIARAAFFLGSEWNSFMTGQTMVVDGGFTSL